jgi:hypothetical protein
MSRARDLYLGRTFLDAAAVADTLGAELAVVSAGLGWVDADDLILPYELTVADGNGSILPRLEAIGASTPQWWARLNQVRRGLSDPLAERLRMKRYERVLVALPARYLEMLGSDLDRIPHEARSAIRIFTSPAGRAMLGRSWRDSALAYDERLDDPRSPYRGTRVDFAQRAMRHFVEGLRAVEMSLPAAHAAVEASLAPLDLREMPRRLRLDDAEVRELLREHWRTCAGQSSRLLRFLRDTQGVACEQSRFRALWLQVRAEMITSSAEA